MTIGMRHFLDAEFVDGGADPPPRNGATPGPSFPGAATNSYDADQSITDQGTAFASVDASDDGQARFALAEALRLAGLGYRVTPVTITRAASGKKHARFHRGWRHEEAWSNDPDQIRAWWTDHPDTSFAIGGAANGIEGVDLDVKDGIDAPRWWSEQGLPLSPFTQQTPSGGLHSIWRAPTDRPGLPQEAGKTFGRGIDTRNRAGLFFASGAYVVGEEGSYTTLGGLPPLAELETTPDVVLELFADHSEKERAVRPTDGRIVVHDLDWQERKFAEALQAMRDHDRDAVKGGYRAKLQGAGLFLGRAVEQGLLTGGEAEELILDAHRHVWGDNVWPENVKDIRDALADGPRLERWRVPGAAEAVSDGPEQAVEPTTLEEAHEASRRWLGDTYDLDGLDAVLAALAAERLDGDPLWLLLLSGSGNAKTETVQAAAGAGALVTSTITSEGALLSATGKGERANNATGGLLRKLGSRGVLVIKDVTSILSMNRDARAAVLAALREVYDGSWSRNVGTDGGRTLEWVGRLVVIGAVTTAWDQAHAVIAAMGDRFVILRMDSGTGRLTAGRKAIGNTGSETEMRGELAKAMAGVVAGVDAEQPPTITDEETERLLRAADLVTLARTGVEFDYRGDVIDAHAPEMPTRFAKQLAQLMRGGDRDRHGPDRGAEPGAAGGAGLHAPAAAGHHPRPGRAPGLHNRRRAEAAAEASQHRGPATAGAAHARRAPVRGGARPASAGLHDLALLGYRRCRSDGSGPRVMFQECRYLGAPRAPAGLPNALSQPQYPRLSTNLEHLPARPEAPLPPPRRCCGTHQQKERP
jgi:hypothetical protein